MIGVSIPACSLTGAGLSAMKHIGLKAKRHDEKLHY
jgi:hypothetical protein